MKLKRSSLREQVHDFLLAKIARGELKPGDRIVEARLIEELQASNIPVREAIRELVAKRVLDSAPHKGAWVRQPSILEAIEAFKVRAMLDAGAVHMAIDQLCGNCDHLRIAAKGTADALVVQDVPGFLKHNRDLHRSIVEATDNACLLRTWDSVSIDLHGLFAEGFLEPVDPAVLVDDHLAIVEALDRGDAEKAASLLALHANRLVQCLGQVHEAEQRTKATGRPS
jgi:DNA-binding GntR family transcriptional regulator